MEIKTDTTVSFMLLAHCRLSHWCCVYRELCFHEKVIDLLAHIMPNSAGIDEDNDVLFRIINELHDFVENIALNVLVIRRRNPRKFDLQTLRRYFFGSEVHWKSEVNGASLRAIRYSNREGRQSELT